MNHTTLIAKAKKAGVRISEDFPSASELLQKSLKNQHYQPYFQEDTICVHIPDKSALSNPSVFHSSKEQCKGVLLEPSDSNNVLTRYIPNSPKEPKLVTECYLTKNNHTVRDDSIIPSSTKGFDHIIEKYKEDPRIQNIEFDLSKTDSQQNMRVHVHFRPEQNQKALFYKPPKPSIKQVEIKRIHFSEKDYLLYINGTSAIFAFNESPELESKTFRIFQQLWDAREEVKNEFVKKQGQHISIDKIRDWSDCPSNESTYKHIVRLKKGFRKAVFPYMLLTET